MIIMIIQTRKYDERDEVNVMTKTVAVKKDNVKRVISEVGEQVI